MKEKKIKKVRGKAGRKSRKKPSLTLIFREQLIFLKKQDSDKKWGKGGANGGTINLTTENGKMRKKQEWKGFERRGREGLILTTT
ncbi:hypothetical protein VQ056_24305 [Paenibacillus sp. JTLBN-2024]